MYLVKILEPWSLSRSETSVAAGPIGKKAVVHDLTPQRTIVRAKMQQLKTSLKNFNFNFMSENTPKTYILLT